MKTSRISRRYASGLMKLYNDNSEAQAALINLKYISTLFDIRESARMLQSPVMPASVKLALLNFALEKSGADKKLCSFVDMLVRVSRVSYLPEICLALEELIAEKSGVAIAEVIAAVEIDSNQREQLANQLEKVFNRKISINARVDPKVLGGVWVGVGNSVIDLTVRAKLTNLATAAVQI